MSEHFYAEQIVHDPKTQRRAEAGLFLLTIIWGVTFVIVKNSLPDIDPNTYVTIRFAFAFSVGAMISPRSLLNVNARLLRHGVVLGFLLYAGFMLQTIGLKYTTVSNSGFFTGTTVVFTPLVEVALLRRRPRWNHGTAIIIVVLGLFLLSAPDVGGINYGDVLTLCCAIVFACYMVFLSRYAPQHQLGQFTLVQLGSVAAIGALVMLIIGTGSPTWHPRLIFALIYCAMAANLLSTYAQTKLQPRTTATKAAIIFAAEPLFAALFGYLVNGEVLSVRGLWGAALIMAGLLVSEIIGANRATPVFPLDSTIAGT